MVAQRRANALLRWLGGRLPGAAARRIQVAAYAAEWEADNAAALAADGPLWVALGDSTAQAIGSTSRQHGYVLRLLEELRSRRDPAWRVVNLSRTGALVADVLAEQVPRLKTMPSPSLVTCCAGANDLLRSRGTLVAGLRALASALPVGSVLATLPQGMRHRDTEVANTAVRAEAAAHGLRVADLWSHTGPPWRGKFAADRFHPNDHGYEGWVDAFAEALGLRDRL